MTHERHIDNFIFRLCYPFGKVAMIDKMENWKKSQSVKVGDKCHVEGNTGTVIEVIHKDGNGLDGWTGIRVSFDECTGLIGTYYNNAVYGSSNWAFTYTS